jgi:subtilisin family serine protease
MTFQQQKQQIRIFQRTSTRPSSTHQPTIPPKPTATPPPDGNIILALPNDTAGRIALDHLSASAQGLGCVYLGTLAESLAAYGVENSTFANDLKYIFVLLRSDDGDEVTAINRILRFHCAHGKATKPHGDVEAGETNAQLTLYSQSFGTIGLPFKLNSANSMHGTYLSQLNVANAHNNNILGQSVNVAVVDSGTDGACVFVNQFSDIYDTTNTARLDKVGHGTAMASIINSVAPQANVFSIRISDLSPVLWTTMAGICKALFDYQAHIINLSIGFSSLGSRCKSCGMSAQARSLVFEKFLWSLKELGQGAPFKAPIYVTATGNDGASKFDHPAAYDSTVAVGSINSKLRRSSFSNYGTQHHHYLVMPGGDYDDVKKTFVEWAGEGVSGKCLGTSAAAAYASGMLALYRSDPRYSTQTRQKFLDQIINNCDRAFQHHNWAEYGAGYLSFK